MSQAVLSRAAPCVTLRQCWLWQHVPVAGGGARCAGMCGVRVVSYPGRLHHPHRNACLTQQQLTLSWTTSIRQGEVVERTERRLIGLVRD